MKEDTPRGRQLARGEGALDPERDGVGQDEARANGGEDPVYGVFLPQPVAQGRARRNDPVAFPSPRDDDEWLWLLQATGGRTSSVENTKIKNYAREKKEKNERGKKKRKKKEKKKRNLGLLWEG